MKKIKIGIDIRSLAEQNYSGISEYTLNLVKRITSDYYFKKINIKKYKLFYNSYKKSSKISQLNKELNQLNKNIEVIHTKYPNKLFNWIMQKILFWPKIDQLVFGKKLNNNIFWMTNIAPVVFSKNCQKIITIHDLSFLRYPFFFDLKRRMWHKIINVKKLIKKFDHIVAVSENTKKDIIELCKIDEKKITVIYPEISRKYQVLKEDDHRLALVKKKYNLEENFILYLGSLEPRKNIFGIIKAYEKLRKNKTTKINLVIAGGNGWKNKNIFQAYKNSKYKNDIIFLGYIPETDKVYLYNLASVFVFPSFYEGFGYPVLEAMACGVPVVTSFSSSLPELVGNAALMVDPYRFDNIANSLTQIITNQNLRKNLINQGLKRVQKFRYTKDNDKYFDLLRKCLK